MLEYNILVYILPMYFDFLINQNPYMELESFTTITPTQMRNIGCLGNTEKLINKYLFNKVSR